MTLAHKIPEILAQKITLMTYGLSPHPCGILILDHKKYIRNKVVESLGGDDIILGEEFEEMIAKRVFLLKWAITYSESKSGNPVWRVGEKEK